MCGSDLSVQKSVFLEVGMEHTRPVGLDEVKAAAGEPAPAVVHVGAERGVVGVTARELIAVVVYDGVYPYKLAVSAHFNVCFNDVSTLLECDLVACKRVARNISPRATAMGNYKDFLLCRRKKVEFFHILYLEKLLLYQYYTLIFRRC